MLITPVALATIMGLAFGTTGGSFSISDIPVAVVNLDEGTADGNFGNTIAAVLLSESIDDNIPGDAGTCSLLPASNTDDNSEQQSLDDLFNAVALSDPDEARTGVDNGDYDVVVIIPANFSATLTPEIDITNLPDTPQDIEITPATLEVYGNGGSPISSEIVRSVTESIVNQMVTGSTALNATLTTILSDSSNLMLMSAADDEAFTDLGCAFDPNINPIQVERLALDDVQAQSDFVQIMVFMGSAQAVFFAIFTMNNSLLSIYNDKRIWILQRLLMTPTPRLYIIGGKILGATVLVLVQVGLLLLTMTGVASLVMGEPLFIWGDNILLLFVLTLVVGLSVSGLGVFVIGLASTPEQANILGTLTALGMAMLGGAFGFQLEALQRYSIIYWGVDGYNKLSGGSTDIGMNLIILLAVGAVLFIIGSWLFNRRIEV